MDEEISQRLHIMKFVFMIMVVYIHSDALPELPFTVKVPDYLAACKTVMTDGICAVAIPCFFFVSGILLFSKEFTWISNMKKKARSIVLPYFVINSFWILFFFSMQCFEKTAPYFSAEAYKINSIDDVVKAYLAPLPLYYPFWFLRDLIILNLFAKVIKVIVDKLSYIFILFIVLIGILDIQIPLLLSNNSFYIFVLSCYVVKYQIDFKSIHKVKVEYAGIIYIGMMVLRFIHKNTVIDLLYDAVGFCFYYQLAGCIRKSRLSKPILWAAQFTFFIYAFHEYYEAMIKKIIMMIVPQYGWIQVVEYFLLPILIICICIMIGAIFRKRIPIVYRLICGRR